MPRRNRPSRIRRVQTSKVARLDAMIVRAFTGLPIANPTTGGK